jgi:hypothetical protein
LGRISAAFSAFFGILFGGGLPESVAKAFGYSKQTRKAESAKPAESTVKTTDGALQILGILQRDARLIDFLMEDVAPYSDEQIGAAVRNIHAQSQEVLKKYMKLLPVIDGVEGTFTKSESAGPIARETGAIKFIGNLPAQGKPAGGTLRHRGWRADTVNLPSVSGKQNLSILAPAELEVE